MPKANFNKDKIIDLDASQYHVIPKSNLPMKIKRFCRYVMRLEARRQAYNRARIREEINFTRAFEKISQQRLRQEHTDYYSGNDYSRVNNKPRAQNINPHQEVRSNNFMRACITIIGYITIFYFVGWMFVSCSPDYRAAQKMVNDQKYLEEQRDAEIKKAYYYNLNCVQNGGNKKTYNNQEPWEIGLCKAIDRPQR